jgi:hypothetical protein
MNWKTLLTFALPMIEAAGQERIDRDENDTGRDDIEGVSLVYAAKLLKALLSGKTPPKAPDALR